MSLIGEARALSATTSPGVDCQVRRALTDHPALADEIREAIRDHSISAGALARTFTGHGVDISAQVIGRHRRGDCRRCCAAGVTW